MQSFAAMTEVKNFLLGFSIDQVIIYLVAVIILLTRPRGLLGQQGVMED
jgi:branched-subunit amino acid ABC-type transport system permease component